MKITVEHILDNMDPDWLFDGPVVDALHEATLDDAVNHIMGCLESVCYYDLDTGQELDKPHKLVDSVRDYPELMARITEQWAEHNGEATQ